MIQKIMTVLIWGYFVACAMALIVALIGVFGAEGESLAAVWVIALALPWSILIGMPTGLASSAMNTLLIVFYIAVNLSIMVLFRNILNKAR